MVLDKVIFFLLLGILLNYTVIKKYDFFFNNHKYYIFLHFSKINLCFTP